MKELIKKLLNEHLIKSPFKGKNILYHSTFIDRMIDILKANEIKPLTKHTIDTRLPNTPDNVHHGVSLTRNNRLRFSDVQFMFDGDLLKRDYGNKIGPIDYYKNSPDYKSKSNPDRSTFDFNEAEEFVIGPLKNLKKYLVGIQFDFTTEEIQEFGQDNPEYINDLKQQLNGLPAFDKNFNVINL